MTFRLTRIESRHMQRMAEAWCLAHTFLLCLSEVLVSLLIYGQFHTPTLAWKNKIVSTGKLPFVQNVNFHISLYLTSLVGCTENVIIYTAVIWCTGSDIVVVLGMGRGGVGGWVPWWFSG